MTLEELMTQLARWWPVLFGGWSIGFGFAFLVWQTGYIARALSEFLRSR